MDDVGDVRVVADRPAPLQEIELEPFMGEAGKVARFEVEAAPGIIGAQVRPEVEHLGQRGAIELDHI